jgi:uroporphyrinogen-III decarboxylase
MKKLIINLHSFVDLITNSSSEIFIQASHKFIETIKEMVNNLFELAQSNLKFDDVFVAELEVMDYESYEYVKESEITDEHRTENCDGFGESRIVVVVKENNPNGETAAKILSKLQDLFDIQAKSNY